ncbi:fatty-acyl-CoA synthase [Sphingomonas kyeonggiensis]|uniref:AMP-binding protein n=1 Tax=Sphingomonas kyeonggiensis TaxID=1268553 RepID=UPI00278A7A2A|nr:AMP-binding protein [Sphingomonas kyeonggiensis]MDQ0251981.1 fatty-acyl-CoA synthase [Sphingomonas kyeonggiensis]
MQPFGLTVDKFLDHAAKWFQDCEVVEADAGSVVRRSTYAALRARSNLMSGALAALGLRQGEVVGTLAWNTIHHFEIYYAAMGMGLVCHTLNPRLTAAHLAAMVNEAENRVLAVSADLVPLACELVAQCPTIEHVIVLDAPAADIGTLGSHRVQVWHHDALLEAHGAAAAWGAFDENAPAGLCYTSGTTGSPKGVVYTHRSNYLHTLRALQADAVAITARDTLLLGVPMFHANGWGMPFAAPAAGTKLVLPGRTLDGPSLARLIRDEGVTVAVGVQTVWLTLADQAEASGEAFPALERVLIGGSSCPDALLRRLEEKLGARVQTSWGMTELSPVGAIAPRDLPADAAPASGRPIMGLDLKLTDAEGNTLVPQRNVLGHLKVKGHSVIERYFRAEESALDGEGYFDTGDLAMLDAAGNLTICGRAKDLIKSGGEWINPNEIEAIVGTHPAVRHVAVIARADDKWGERPVLIVESQGEDPRALLEMLRGKVADWWIPGEVAEVPAMPLAASGKIDKKRLREEYAEGRIAGRKVGR